MVLYPIKVVDIELSQPIPTIEGLEGYMGLQGLVRLHGVPLGYVKAPISLGKCTATTLSKLILEEHSEAIICQLLKNGLASPNCPAEFTLENLIDLPPVEYAGEWPLVTVAVCTRDRPDDIKLCLEAISQLNYPYLDLLVVDNAPQTEATKELIQTHYPQVRYAREPRPGLDWARNRAILEAQGEIIAYTDDDVAVDTGWVKGLVQAFLESPDTMVVTGLVVPYELETEAQVLFEEYGGFGRGFKTLRYQTTLNQSMPWQWLGAGQFGTGANMAYRKSVFETIGYFDPALDVGTPTNGGGDLEMFIRVLKAGYGLVYEPTALIRHRHRRKYAQLKRQISFNGSLYALWLSLAIAYPDLRGACAKIGIWWMLYWNVRRTLIASFHQTQFPKDLILAEFWGAFSSLKSYQASTRRVAEIIHEHGWQTEKSLPIRYCSDLKQKSKAKQSAIAIRQIELSQPLSPLIGLEEYEKVRVFVSWHHSPFGSIDHTNNHQNIFVSTLSRLIVDQFGIKILDPLGIMAGDVIWTQAMNTIASRYRLSTQQALDPLPDSVMVSVVIATFDRPDDLRNCLLHLRAQQTSRWVEIIVVDNHPSSGLTPTVIHEFPEVVLVNEPRQGLAYARNAGFIASQGDILIATDDDVTVPPDWIEKLITPFNRPDVMVVSGNVLPIELEDASQQAFENYGGLGRGFEPLEVGGAWYDLFPHKPSPTWSLGATANAAFRASIFHHPNIGLMDEALGPGMPSGVGEDTYVFYKVLKAGYTIVYNPKAFVWHKHRKTRQALERQLYGYSKGHVSYNLTTWLHHGDWRGLAQVLLGLPYAHYYRIKEYLLNRSEYPLSLIWLEIRGNLAGPWSLWQSHRRVKKFGRSQPYVPANARNQDTTEQQLVKLTSSSQESLQSSTSAI
ncbi:glycosyltransferase [Nodosilinea sp. LEGE 07298]|uniref:glycosyltransferase family 2 protein n=1 Tax=Nodosilinea sp. LEGE 07298 TaxID=2777970 RepID=UPI001882FFBA|nr:glycosyltransferase [Nodosilinea sp. LEGE 07298]MBE9111786.1 glycosyltransferase [Nodosilinea sp. LEGE 07298]